MDMDPTVGHICYGIFWRVCQQYQMKEFEEGKEKKCYELHHSTIRLSTY